MEENPQNDSGKTGQEQDVISNYFEGNQQLELHSAENNLKKARNAIFFIAALILIGNLIMMGVSDSFNTTGLIITLIACGIFVGLAFMTKKQPLTSVIIALILFVALWVIDIVVLGPEYIVKGIIVKAIIIYFLITGIKYAKETERLRKEMKSFGNRTA
jgi:Flp pilus assembly protein TadB